MYVRHFNYMINPRLIVTEDGSPTLYREDIDECYHSTHGAITESRYIFIQQALQHRIDIGHTGELKIFELGLGTALNATLCAMTDNKIYYAAIEKYPIGQQLAASIDFGTGIDHQLFNDIHQAPWNQLVNITPNFKLHKILGDFNHLNIDTKFDVIFMDAFSPEKQADLWTADSLFRLSDMLLPRGVLTTYCAKGHIRRIFKSFGLIAERLPGPPGGKREILRITKPE